MRPVGDGQLRPQRVYDPRQVPPAVIAQARHVPQLVRDLCLLPPGIVLKPLLPVAIHVADVPVLPVMVMGAPAPVPFRHGDGLFLIVVLVLHPCPVRELLADGPVLLVILVLHRGDPPGVRHPGQFPAPIVLVGKAPSVRAYRALKPPTSYLVGKAPPRVVRHLPEVPLFRVGEREGLPAVLPHLREGSLLPSLCVDKGKAVPAGVLLA